MNTAIMIATRVYVKPFNLTLIVLNPDY